VVVTSEKPDLKSWGKIFHDWFNGCRRSRALVKTNGKQVRVYSGVINVRQD